MSNTAASLRRKIATASDLESVVRTMKAMAASSISQYESAVRSLDDYDRTVQLGLLAGTPEALIADLKAHPTIAPLLAGSTLREYGAHLIPEGGYDTMPALAADGQLVAASIPARRFDTGDKLDYLKANVEFGLKREDLGAPFLAYLKELVAER